MTFWAKQLTVQAMLISKPLFIRSAALGGYLALAEELGIDAHALLRSLRIDPKTLKNPDQPIPILPFVKLLELSSEYGKCPDFGLRLSRGWNIKVMGVTGLLALNEPDVEHALVSISKYLHIHNEGLLFTLGVIDDLARMSFTVNVGSPVPVKQSVELAVGVGVNVLRDLLGNDWNPSEVYFTHSAPPDTSLFRRIFRSPVYFNQDFNGIDFPTEQIKKPLKDADGLMHKHLLRYISSLDTKHGTDVLSKARRIISDLISSGRFSKALIAGYLSMSPRTFHRRLEDQGYNFKKLTEEVRANLAAQHLSDSDKSLTEIAELLGYSDLSAFSRFFSRMYGIAPSDWRRKSAQNPK